jgi:hypothetical protein
VDLTHRGYVNYIDHSSAMLLICAMSGWDILGLLCKSTETKLCCAVILFCILLRAVRVKLLCAVGFQHGLMASMFCLRNFDCARA